MNVVLRLLANPKLLARFMRTKAGRAAALKYGNMMLKSKMAQDAINKFMNKNNQTLAADKKYSANVKEFEQLRAQIAKLQAQIDKNRDDQDAVQTATFTMGRRVIEMQRLYAQMQMELQKIQQMQMMAQKTR